MRIRSAAGSIKKLPVPLACNFKLSRIIWRQLRCQVSRAAITSSGGHNLPARPVVPFLPHGRNIIHLNYIQSYIPSSRDSPGREAKPFPPMRHRSLIDQSAVRGNRPGILRGTNRRDHRNTRLSRGKVTTLDEIIK